MKKFNESLILDTIESDIIKSLNDADNKLSKIEFERLAESIISYIDEIGSRK